VQFTASGAVCANAAIRGEPIAQDLNISVDLMVPRTGSNVTVAGPYFRSRAASAGDGIIGGMSAGYWIQLVSTGEVRVEALNPFGLVATTGTSTSFDASMSHNLQVAVQGATLQVALDGKLLTFMQAGAVVGSVALPPSNGSNDGAVGVAFGAPDNRGQAGGQRAKNLVIGSYGPLGK